MALTYIQDNPYSIANKSMSLIPQTAPANMTLIPNAQKPNTMTPLVPQTNTSVVYSQPAQPVLSIETKPIQTQIESRSATVTTPITNFASAVSIPRNSKPDNTNNTNGGGSDKNKKRIDWAKYATYAGAALKSAAAIADSYSYTQLRREVEGTKDQYETQKKIIDTNIDKTESALMENLMSNMADLDVMTAARNVDLSSQAIAGDKAKGAIDLGKDIADMRTNGALQKAALDLEYAMNVRKAKQQEINSYINAGLQIASTALSLV